MCMDGSQCLLYQDELVIMTQFNVRFGLVSLMRTVAQCVLDGGQCPP